jgi:hypothetical protein
LSNAEKTGDHQAADMLFEPKLWHVSILSARCDRLEDLLDTIGESPLFQKPFIDKTDGRCEK